MRSVFRARSRDGYLALAKEHSLPLIDPSVWKQDWGVHLQPCGSGENNIKYLGRYVYRTAIGDARIISVTDTHVSFRWKDRANGGAERIETVEGRSTIPITVSLFLDHGQGDGGLRLSHEKRRESGASRTSGQGLTRAISAGSQA